MRIVSRLQGGLERRQSIFIPETFVKVTPLQSTGFIFHHAARSEIEW